MDLVHFARQAWSPGYATFLIFSNRTIIKGDTATFVKQSQNKVFGIFHITLSVDGLFFMLLDNY